MANPEAVATEGGLMQRIQDLEMQVRFLLEQQFAGVNGGVATGFSLDAYDVDENLLVRMGTGVGTGSEEGLEVRDDAGRKHLLIVGTEGMVVPQAVVPFSPTVSFGAQPYNVTSGSFVDVLWASALRVPSDSVSCWVRASIAAGTTGEVRLRTQSGATTDPITVNTTGVAGHVFDWIHGVPLHTDETFYVQARRTGGAGNVSVFDVPTGLTFIGKRIYGATANGL